jgi:hypothetical protein
VSDGVKGRRLGYLVASTLVVGVAAYLLWFLHESRSFRLRTNEVGNALFIEQVEALRVIKGASIDKYRERLVLTLRDQLTRLREAHRSGDALSPQVQRELQYICQRVPEIVTLARAVPHEGPDELCSRM